MRNCAIYHIPVNEAISPDNTNCVNVWLHFSGVYKETENSAPLFEIVTVKNHGLYPMGDHVVGVKRIPDMICP